METTSKRTNCCNGRCEKEDGMCTINLSPEQIKEIALEVVTQLKPWLATQPQEEGPQSPSVEMEIAQVKAAGLDLVEYLKARAKVPRKPIIRKKME